MRYDIHHIHKRKRVHEKLQKYPHPNKWVRFLDNFLLVFAVVGPASLLPQIIKIFSLKAVGGVSLITYCLWALGAIPWVIYGVVHKAKPIIIAYSLWFLSYLIVLFGILIYR